MSFEEQFRGEERRKDAQGSFAIVTELKYIRETIEKMDDNIAKLFDRMDKESRERDGLERQFALCRQKGDLETKGASDKIAELREYIDDVVVRERNEKLKDVKEYIEKEVIKNRIVPLEEKPDKNKNITLVVIGLVFSGLVLLFQVVSTFYKAPTNNVQQEEHVKK